MKKKSTDTTKNYDVVINQLLTTNNKEMADDQGLTSGGEEKQSLSKSAAARRNTGKKTSGIVPFLRVVVPALLLVAIAVFALTFSQKSTEYRIDGAAEQYYGGQSYLIPDGARMLRVGEGTTNLTSDTLERTMDALPIYYKNKQVAVLPQDMVYYAPRDNLCLKVEHFSELTYTTAGLQQIKLKRDTADIQAGFLFDGREIYLFFEPVKLSLNGSVFDLGAMSCIDADVQNGVISVYNTEGDMLFEEMKSECSVYPESKDYTVYLLNDSMELYDGTRTLLFTDPQQLDPLF